MRLSPYLLTSALLLWFSSEISAQVGMAAYYKRAAQLCENAARKYDSLGCTESAKYVRKIEAWNQCMVNNLAGSTCGVQPPFGDAPSCSAANGGGSGGTPANGSADPMQQLKQGQSTQGGADNTSDAYNSAYHQAINNGKKESGAMVEGTMAGAQQLSDPKESLVYMGVGLTTALFAYSNEKKEAKRKEQQMLQQEREDELKAWEAREAQRLATMKASLDINPALFNFICGSTSYHISSFKGDHGSGGALTGIERMDLYDITVRVEKVLNSSDSLFIYETVRFKNLTDNKDSCVASLVTIPFNKTDQVESYNGDYTNSFNTEDGDFKIFRYKSLSSKTIRSAFSRLDDEGMDNKSYGDIHSGLTDVYITTLGNAIWIRKKYVPNYKDKQVIDFSNVAPALANRYMLVFGENTTALSDFVSDLNFVKN